ncbi:hypothetical protein [Niallia oryzisoli]|uniref:hypothetical protein n=1 Tax=Niallia oryzisoli TaxID=1737571 RepID=UPI00373696BB
MNTNIENEEHIIASLQRDINLTLAFLLLSGQLTIRGVFVNSGRFSISLSGPIIGGARTIGKFGDDVTNTIIDIIDAILSILLIMDEIRLVGVLVGPGRVSLTVSGPMFGDPLNEPSLPNVRFFRQMISTHFHVDPNHFRHLEKE